MYAATSILAIIAVAATFFGLALEYASIALYSDKGGSMAISIVGAGVVVLGLASEYGLHLESSEGIRATATFCSAGENSERRRAAAVFSSKSVAMWRAPNHGLVCSGVRCWRASVIQWPVRCGGV